MIYKRQTALLPATLFPFLLLAQGFDDVIIKTTQLSETVYMLEGRGGNIGLCAGPDGVFMIDDQFAPLTDKIKAAVAAISPQPVKFIINTHWHGDHTGGNENFGKQGAIIVAHENVRQRLSSEQFQAFFNRKTSPATQAAWPVITFTRDVAFHLNGEDIRVEHVHHAHTDGDVFIRFKQSDVLHMGDVYFAGRYPFIDLDSGGSVHGVLRAVDRALEISTDKTRIIPGHGPLSNKKELQEWRKVIGGLVDTIEQRVKQGNSLEEILAAKLTAAYDAAYGQHFISGDAFVRIVCNDLSRQNKR